LSSFRKAVRHIHRAGIARHVQLVLSRRQAPCWSELWNT
jgi:hypothetical protein